VFGINQGSLKAAFHQVSNRRLGHAADEAAWPHCPLHAQRLCDGRGAAQVFATIVPTAEPGAGAKTRLTKKEDNYIVLFQVTRLNTSSFSDSLYRSSGLRSVQSQCLIQAVA